MDNRARSVEFSNYKYDLELTVQGKVTYDS